MADYTEQQYKDAARKALADNNPVAAKKFVDLARKAGASNADTSFMGRLKDNVIGVDDGVESAGERLGTMIGDNIFGIDNGVESPGEKLGTLIRGGGAATARGMADVPALPANLLQLGAMVFEKATGADQPSGLSRALSKLPDTRDMLASVPVIGPESQFKAPGTAGDFVSTMGEFAGGAGVFAGPGAMLRYGAVPGAASETAGQLTEGTAAEPYARTAAGLGAALLAGPKPGTFGGNDEAARMANKLQDSGVRNITVGQSKGSQPLMAAEGRLQATQQQIDDFTASTMKQLGSTKKLATPDNLMAVEKAIVKQMDDAVAGVSVVPSSGNAKTALDVAKRYVERVPAGSLTPRMRGIANEIQGLVSKAKPVSLAQMKEWRTDIGRLTTSTDAATRDAAHGLRGLIDDMTDAALTKAGRTDDIAKLAAGRESYRNYIAVRDAASRAGAEGGTLSPQALNQSLIRSQGREAYATGRTTPMGDFTRAGASVLRPASTVSPGGVRAISGAVPLASAGAMGAGVLGMGGNPALAAIVAAGGALAPEAAKAAMRSNLAQQLMRGPKQALTQPLPSLAGLLSGGN